MSDVLANVRKRVPKSGRIIPVIYALIVFFVSLSVLYLGDNVGLSDNGDFRRVLLTNKIEYADEIDHYYLFKEDYVMDLNNADTLPAAVYEAWQTSDEDVYSSPQFLIIKVSKELNVLANYFGTNPLERYKIGFLAVLYIAMFSFAAGAIFAFFNDAKLKIRIAVGVLFIFVFCDAGYLLYFNSFYGEPLQYTALLLMTAFGLMIYKRPRIVTVIGFYLSLYFFAGAKLANIPFALISAVLALVISIMRRDTRFRIGVTVMAVICVVSIGHLYFTIPEWMDRDTTYQSVFLGVIKDSDTPAQDLEELGVDGKYAVLQGTHAYMDDDEYAIDIHSDEFVHDFYDKVSKVDIVRFYVRHPIRLFWEMCHAIENSAYIRPPVVGNSEKVRMDFTDKFSAWSKLRVFLKFLYTPWVIFAFFTLITLYMVFINIYYFCNRRVESTKKRYMIFALDLLIIGLWVNLVMPIIGNGEADLPKHMFLFTNCIDIMFFIGILAILSQPPKLCAAYITAAAVLAGLFRINIPKKTVTFGTYNGSPICWEIFTRFDNGTQLLVTKDCVEYMPFDSYSNNWSASNVRAWLNTDFLSEFTDEELSKIQLTTNDVILTYSEREWAASGNHSHYWNFTRSLAADMADTAYSTPEDDMVFLPTLGMMKKIDARDAYWIMCPYTSNDIMERYMNSDGFILHTEISNIRGVRPVIRVKTD